MPPVFLFKNRKKMRKTDADRFENSQGWANILVFTIRICYIETRTKLPGRIPALDSGQLVQFKQEVL
jgi:hypothetical protein